MTPNEYQTKDKSNTNTFLSRQALENLIDFKYSCKNDSILYNYVTSPALDNYLMKYIPLWVAPNTLTLMSFIFNFFTFILISFEAGNDFNKALSKITCFMQAFSHFIYIVLDNSDGKQARRTNSASPLGLLFDHGFDALTTCLVAFNMSHMSMTGNTGLRSGIIFIALFSGFWANVYEEWVCGHMHLGLINGADEGNLIITFGSLLTSVFGSNIWKITLINFGKLGLDYNFTVADMMLGILCLGSLSCFTQAIKNIYKKTKSLSMLLSFLTYQSTNMWLIVGLILFSFNFDEDFHSRSLYLIFLLLSLTFSRIVIEMQVNIVTKESHNKLNTFILLTHIALFFILISLSTRKFFLVKQFLIILLITFNFVSFMNFVLVCLKEMKNFLGIKIFAIQKQVNQ